MEDIQQNTFFDEEQELHQVPVSGLFQAIFLPQNAYHNGFQLQADSSGIPPNIQLQTMDRNFNYRLSESSKKIVLPSISMVNIKSNEETAESQMVFDFKPYL